MSKNDSSRDAEILRRFIGVYCEKHHDGKEKLCDECSDLLDYALTRLEKCPLDPKPKCRKCPVHCYSPEYRKRIQEVMRFSGIYFVKRGRLDWLVKHFLT